MYGSQTFDGRLEEMALLCRNQHMTALFSQEMKSLVDQVAAVHGMGGDPLVTMRRVGALKGLLTAQERWLEAQAEHLVATGQAQWA